jgi:5,5'-dehydrodivanillate O-demethylase
MVTAEENERLTRVGPGTPMGNLLRRYWHPVAGVAEMEERWTYPVRILGEDLVLYKSRAGEFGLIGAICPHRRASMLYGIPSEDGIRCPYHGWSFDGTGRCLEQPNEPAESTFKDKVRLAGYPIEEMGGLLWAYLGPQPAPLLPRYDGFVVKDTIRHCGRAVVNCNWLQIMENSVDPMHTQWLHGNLYEFLREQRGEPYKVAISRHHKKIAFDEFPWGIIKRRLLEGQSEDASDWTTGHPVVFPNMLAVGNGAGSDWVQYTFQIRVPRDDVSTDHFWFHAFVPPAGADVPQHLLDRVPMYEAPIKDANDQYLLEYIHVQDIMAWETQGPIAARHLEAIGTTDIGLVTLRKMMLREMKKVEDGHDPIATIRDPEAHVQIDLPLEKNKAHYADGFASMLKRHMSWFSPIAPDLLEIFAEAPKELAIH